MRRRRVRATSSKEKTASSPRSSLLSTCRGKGHGRSPAGLRKLSGPAQKWVTEFYHGTNLHSNNEVSGERPQSSGSKPYPRLFFFGITNMLGVDSCVFLIFTTRVGLKTRLNGVKSICFEQSRKFESTFSKVLVYVFVRKESISGRSSETLWELRSIGGSLSGTNHVN